MVIIFMAMYLIVVNVMMSMMMVDHVGYDNDDMIAIVL